MNMQTFEEKVKSMTASEIIMAMVNGVRKEWVKLDFSTFGSNEDGVCYGCAATNAICQIAGEVIPISHIRMENHHDFLKSDEKFLEYFEMAINSLRSANIDLYNLRARNAGFAEIKGSFYPYPRLHNRMSKEEINENLVKFEKLAKLQIITTLL